MMIPSPSTRLALADLDAESGKPGLEPALDPTPHLLAHPVRAERHRHDHGGDRERQRPADE